ncbi:MAG: response regulator [Gemmataceae bacterium]|nr:response regulator [Gemmataceae bacterium]
MVCHRVLLVEDNNDIRESLAHLLRIMGYDVQEAADGPAGVNKAVQWRPDAAVVDVGLPGYDGFEVARRLRNRLGGTIRLIALTAYHQAAHEAMQAGFDVFLAKPVEPEELSRRLEQCML